MPSLRRTCEDIRTELLCDNDSGRDATPLVRAMLDPGRYALIVDALSAMSGSYTLRARSFTPASNGVCSGAIPLAPGATLTSQNVANGGMRRDHCRPSAPGGPLFYAVVVPAMNRVTVRADADGIGRVGAAPRRRHVLRGHDMRGAERGRGRRRGVDARAAQPRRRAP